MALGPFEDHFDEIWENAIGMIVFLNSFVYRPHPITVFVLSKRKLITKNRNTCYCGLHYSCRTNAVKIVLLVRVPQLM